QSTGTLHLTSPAQGEARSVFYHVPQGVTGFTASFTYQVLNAHTAFAGGCGAAFVLQNSPGGVSAIGTGPLAYSGIASSAAVTLELYTGSSASGYYTNGNVTGGSPNTGTVSLFSGDPINVTLQFDGALLHESMVDTVTQASYTPSPFIASNL